MFGGFAPLPLRLGGDANEGWSASQQARAEADLLALARVAPFAWIRYAQTSQTVTLAAYRSRAGNDASVQPTLVRAGAGITDILFANRYEDALGNAGFLNIQFALATHAAGSSYFAEITCDVTDYAATGDWPGGVAPRVRVKIRKTTGAEADTQVYVAVWA